MTNKTHADLFREVYEQYGTQTTTQFHVDLSKELSDKEYQEHFNAYKSVGSVLDDLVKKEDK